MRCLLRRFSVFSSSALCFQDHDNAQFRPSRPFGRLWNPRHGRHLRPPGDTRRHRHAAGGRQRRRCGGRRLRRALRGGTSHDRGGRRLLRPRRHPGRQGFGPQCFRAVWPRRRRPVAQGLGPHRDRHPLDPRHHGSRRHRRLGRTPEEIRHHGLRRGAEACHSAGRGRRARHPARCRRLAGGHAVSGSRRGRPGTLPEGRPHAQGRRDHALPRIGPEHAPHRQRGPGRLLPRRHCGGHHRHGARQGLAPHHG